MAKPLPPGRILVQAYHCERCSHTWLPRSEERPLLCPKCKSLRWDRETPAKNVRSTS